MCSFLYMSHLDAAHLLPDVLAKVKEEFRSKTETYIIISFGELSQVLLNKLQKVDGVKVFYSSRPYPYSFIRCIFRKCKVFLCPARFKFFGLPFVEAMYEGSIPVVSDYVVKELFS